MRNLLWLGIPLLLLAGLTANAETTQIPATATFIDVSKICNPETHRYNCTAATKPSECKCVKKE